MPAFLNAMSRNCPLELNPVFCSPSLLTEKLFSVHSSSFMVSSFNVSLYHQPYEEILLMSNVRSARIIVAKTKEY